MGQLAFMDAQGRTAMAVRGKAYASAMAAPAAMWLFGLLTGALCLNAGWNSMNNPSAAVSVFGTDSTGSALACSGLTFGGPTQTWFGGIEALAGMEGAFMAVGLGFLVLMSLMISVLPHRGARIVGPLLVMAWTLLWAGNALVVGVNHMQLALFPLALVCLLGTWGAAVQLREGFRFRV